MRFDVDRARWAVQRAAAGRVPNVMVMSGAQYDNATEFAMANVQVSLPMPVFNRNQGDIARPCGELTAAQAALEARELALAQQLATAMSDYNTASRRVAKYSESILPAARQSLDLVSSKAYEQGELEYLDILATQRTYTEKNLAYLDDLESAWKKWAEIDGLLVGPLPAIATDAISGRRRAITSSVQLDDDLRVFDKPTSHASDDKRSHETLCTHFFPI